MGVLFIATLGGLVIVLAHKEDEEDIAALAAILVLLVLISMRG